jgi:hypothetical protein
VTAKKSNPGPRGQEKAIEPSHEAETEKDVVGDAEPDKRWDAVGVAQWLTGAGDRIRSDGNRLTITVSGPNGLVQTFHATVEEGIREF